MSASPVWKPISDHPGEFWDGQRYLVALRVGTTRPNEEEKWAWEYHKIQIMCDSESPVELYYANSDLIGHMEPFTDWTWDDFEFYLEIEDL